MKRIKYFYETQCNWKNLLGILMVVPGFQVMIFKRSLGFFFWRRISQQHEEMGSSLTLNFKNSVAVLVLRLGDLKLLSFKVANPKSCCKYKLCIREGTIQMLLHETAEFYSRAGQRAGSIQMRGSIQRLWYFVRVVN
jgi:hypothetical protein